VRLGGLCLQLSGNRRERSERGAGEGREGRECVDGSAGGGPGKAEERERRGGEGGRSGRLTAPDQMERALEGSGPRQGLRAGTCFPREASKLRCSLDELRDGGEGLCGDEESKQVD
jgi:hypothetical protein